MKSLVQNLTPPGFVKLVNKGKALTASFFNTYEEALRSIGDEGYETKDLVKLVIDKNCVFRDQVAKNPVFDLGTIKTMVGLGACALANPKVRVLDFGGGGGYHYFIAKSFWRGRSFDWSVIETPALAEAAKQKLQTEELKFYSSIEQAKKSDEAFDLVFTSSALQYCPNPETFLQELVDLKAKHLFLTRTPFHLGDKNLISIQSSRLSANGPGPVPYSHFQDRDVRYPITFVSQKNIERILQQKYRIRFSIDEGPGSFTAGKHKLNMIGYFCELL